MNRFYDESTNSPKCPSCRNLLSREDVSQDVHGYHHAYCCRCHLTGASAQSVYGALNAWANGRIYDDFPSSFSASGE
jgi:hypothetical protein